MIQQKKKFNIWRAAFSLTLVLVILISSIYVYNTYFTEVKEEDEEQQIEYDYNYLIIGNDYYVTPDNANIENLSFNIMNESKYLNNTVYITIYRYLRDSFDLVENTDQPRPPVETIERGYGSSLDLSLLLTSLLLENGLESYTFLSDEYIVTIMFLNGIMYIFDFNFYSPLEVDDPFILFSSSIFSENITVVSNDYAGKLDSTFYNWARRRL